MGNLLIPKPANDSKVEYIMDETGCYLQYKDENGNDVKVGYIKDE